MLQLFNNKSNTGGYYKNMNGVDFTPLINTAVDAFISIGVALIGLGVYYIRQYVKSKIQNEELKSSLLLTLNTIENSVKSSMMNMTDDIQKILADGKVTPEELAMLKKAAKEEYQKQIDPKLKERLQAHINDIDKFIEQKVEAEIMKIKSKTV